MQRDWQSATTAHSHSRAIDSGGLMPSDKNKFNKNWISRAKRAFFGELDPLVESNQTAINSRSIENYNFHYPHAAKVHSPVYSNAF